MPEDPAVETTAAPPERPYWVKTLFRVIGIYGWFFGSMFAAAGRFDWKRGWIALALWVVGMSTMGVVVRRYNPQLLKEREKWRRKDTKPFDKVFLAIYLPLVMLQPAVAGLDAARYRWSSMPFPLVYVGAILFILSLILIGWAMVINPHAESSVRIQTDRNQTVITSGPYRFVHHPMYVGFIVMYVASSLVWGPSGRWR